MYLPDSWEVVVPDNKTISALKEEFDDIAMVMTLTESHPVISAAIWIDYEDPDLKYYGQFLGSWSSRYLDVLPFSGQSHKLLDPVDVKTNVSNFLNLEADVKPKIRVALERFNLALKRKKMGDAAIDLCIALESMVGGNETNEVTHKVTTRITRFLGGDVDQRARTRDIVKATYNFRSTMVHNGQEPQKLRLVSGSKMNPREILAEATVICVKVLKSILSEGRIPDWQEFDIQP